MSKRRETTVNYDWEEEQRKKKKKKGSEYKRLLVALPKEQANYQSRPDLSKIKQNCTVYFFQVDTSREPSGPFQKFWSVKV